MNVLTWITWAALVTSYIATAVSFWSQRRAARFSAHVAVLRKRIALLQRDFPTVEDEQRHAEKYARRALLFWQRRDGNVYRLLAGLEAEVDEHLGARRAA